MFLDSALLAGGGTEKERGHGGIKKGKMWGKRIRREKYEGEGCGGGQIVGDSEKGR